MDSAKFAKMIRDAGLVCPQCSAHDVDVVFAASKPIGKKKVSYDGFLLALDAIGMS